MQEIYDPDVGDPRQVSPQGSGSQDKPSGLGGLQRPADQPPVEASEDLARQID